MEDAEVIMINLKEQFPDHAPEKSSFFGVFDGHGGRRAADFVAVTDVKQETQRCFFFKLKAYTTSIILLRLNTRIFACFRR